MHIYYSDLLLPSLFSNSSLAKEKEKKYFWLTERHIQALWWEQTFLRSPLTTSEGLPIVVLSPGQWNVGNGPDFLKAHLIIGNEELRGDVEIHLSDESWTRHGHHQDQAYQNTILHISYWEKPKDTSLFTYDGKEIPRVYLHDKLTETDDKISSAIDVTLYPYKPYLGSGRCSSAFFNRIPKEQSENFFESASLWRLFKKGELIISLGNSLENSFLAGLVRSLGFPINTLAFLRLFQILLPFRSEGKPELFQALALGICGLFDIKQNHLNPYFHKLHAIWLEKAHQFPEKVKLKPQRTRPLHHPIRRIATLSYLMCDTSINDYLTQSLNLWHEACAKKSFKAKQLFKKLVDILPNYEDSYWNFHYFFENEIQNKPLTLLGNQIKKEMILNVVLPILYLKSNFSSSMNGFLKIIMGSNSSHSRYLKNRFFGESSQGNLFKHAYVEQGAMQLHHDFCQHFETSCIGCPFVERIEKKLAISCK